MEFECKAKRGDSDDGDGTEIEDSIKFKVKRDDDGHVAVQVEYEQEIETATSETESESQYEVVFNRLIEYQKANNAADENQGYEWDVDVVLQEVDLSNMGTFSAVVDDSNGVTSTLSVSSPDDMATFTFTISRANQEVLDGTGDNTSVSRLAEGNPLSANKMKIDFELKKIEARIATIREQLGKSKAS